MAAEIRDGTGGDLATPWLYPIQFDATGEKVRLLPLSEVQYRAASFLDERLLADGEAGGDWRPWKRIASAAAALPLRAHFIFHIGHVGSTLLARLIGEAPELFCLREPTLLRPLAAAAPPADRATLDPLLRLFSRTWRPGQCAVIKATSFVGERADDLLVQVASARALVMMSSPPVYLRAILGGAASRREIATMAQFRLARLSRRLGGPVEAVSEGEQIAMSWLCETLPLYAASRAHPARMLWMDFDSFLHAPSVWLERALSHLGARAPPHWLRDLVEGPLMRRYSKGQEFAYDADLRRQVLAQAGQDHAREVIHGMDWLQRMAGAYPEIRPVLIHVATLSRNAGTASS